MEQAGRPAEAVEAGRLPPSVRTWLGAAAVLAMLSYLYLQQVELPLRFASVKITLPALALFVVSLLVLAMALRHGAVRMSRGGKRLGLAFLVLLAALLLSGVRAEDHRMWIVDICHVFTLGVTAAGLSILFRAAAPARRVIGTFLGVMAVLSVWGIVQWLAGRGHWHQDAVSQATAGSPGGSMLAQFLYTALILTIAMIPTLPSRGHKIGAFFGCVLMVAAMILTFTRGVYLYLLLSMALMLIMHFRKYFASIGGLLLVLLAFFAVLMALLPSDRRAATLDRLVHMQSETNEYRMDLWKRSLELFQEHPWTGVGFNNFGAVSKIYGGEYDTHNIFIRMLAETGVIGLLSWLVLLGLLGAVMWRSRRSEIGCGLFSVWVGWIVFSCFQPLLASAYGVTFVLICALGMGIRYREAAEEIGGRT